MRPQTGFPQPAFFAWSHSLPLRELREQAENTALHKPSLSVFSTPESSSNLARKASSLACGTEGKLRQGKGHVMGQGQVLGLMTPL